jgi:hypothetical protein
VGLYSAEFYHDGFSSACDAKIYAARRRARRDNGNRRKEIKLKRPQLYEVFFDSNVKSHIIAPFRT